jgi:prevent-host-death family protein
MERTVSAFEARRSFGRVLQEVVAKGDRVIVQRHGEPVAAVVPIALYRQWKRDRDAFFDRLEAIAAHADVPEKEAEELVAEAVRTVRRRAR